MVSSVAVTVIAKLLPTFTSMISSSEQPVLTSETSKVNIVEVDKETVVGF